MLNLNVITPTWTEILPSGWGVRSAQNIRNMKVAQGYISAFNPAISTSNIGTGNTRISSYPRTWPVLILLRFIYVVYFISIWILYLLSSRVNIDKLFVLHI